MKRTVKGFLLRLSIASAIFVVPGLAQDQSASKPRIVATIGETPITEEELRKAAASELDKLNLQLLQMKASAAQTEQQILESNLMRILSDRVFAAEASKQGVTKEAFIAAQIDAKLKQPSQKEIQAFYDANTQRIGKPLEQVSTQIEQYLKNENRNKAVAELYDRLKGAHSVNVLLEPLRLKVGMEGSPSRGPKEAPVTIVEFSDFQCPYCSLLAGTLRELMSKYGNGVRLVYRQFPLVQIHPFAEKAAEASLCAADQNRFWELHDLMFQTQDKLKEDDLRAKAAQLGMDKTLFDTCLGSGKYASKVVQDEREGISLGIGSTPAIFINGRFFSGALPLSELTRLIDQEIKKDAPPSSGNPVVGALNR
jgi:protein-disulfide isomerase